MSSDVAIRIEGLGKAYTISHRSQHVTLAEQALERLRHPFTRTPKETFWALRDIDLEIRHGDVLGLIGRNGAGKSTLLKVLSRITAPTTGKVELFGRIGSLLEVGTGFHPELTGRENIFLNGAILGMRTAEVQRQFDAIVDFAGVERFLDTPVKRYSSGMYVRLAFAVAAHLETEILLVDEVLAVGDQEFQDKCLGKLQDVSRSGRAVVYVSHNLETVTQLCNRAVVLDRGGVSLDGAVDTCVSHYLQHLRSRKEIPMHERDRFGTGEFKVTDAHLAENPCRPAAPVVVHVTVSGNPIALDRYFLSASIRDEKGFTVAQCDSRLSGMWSTPGHPQESFELTLNSPWLKPGQYDVDLYVCNAGVLDGVLSALELQVSPDVPYPGTISDEAVSAAPTLADFSWRRSTQDQPPPSSNIKVPT